MNPIKNEGKAPILAPSAYFVPTLGEIGVKSNKVQSGRQVETETISFDSVFIDDQSETGQVISAFYEAFEYFVSREVKKENTDENVIDVNSTTY